MPRWRIQASTGASVLLCAVLTLPFLGATPLWSDEVDSVDAATRPLAALGRLLVHQDAPLAGYYFLLHGWFLLGGGSAAWVRLPSALAVLVAVGLTAEAGRRVGGPKAGLLAGTLLAANPFVDAFAVETRPYALALAAASGVGLLLLTAPDAPGRRRRAAYAGLVVAGTVAHLFFLLLLPAHLLGLRWARRPLRPWFLPGALAVLLVLPLVALSAGQTAEVGYLHTPGLLSLPGWFQALAGGNGWLAVPAMVLVYVAARVGPVRQRPLLLAWLLLPGPVLLLVSLAHPLYLSRYVLESVPALALLMALAVVGSSRQRLAGGLTLTVLAASVVTGVVDRSVPYRYEDLRSAADVVLDLSKAGDAAVYFPAPVRTAVGYYLQRTDPGAPRPLDVTADPAAGEQRAANFGGRGLDPVQAASRVLARTVVWRVSYDDASARRGTITRVVLGVLRQCYRAGPLQHFGQVVVQRYVRLFTDARQRMLPDCPRG